MRAQRWKVAAIVLAVVAGGATYAWADVAATVNISDPMFSPLITNSGDPTNTDQRVYGWRFFVAKGLKITDIGVFAMHRDAQGQLVDDGLHVTHQMGIWGVKRAGGLDLLRGPLPIGPGGTVENHYVYITLEEPLTMTPDDPTYDRLLIGVWTGINNTDLFYHGPVEAQTLTAQLTGAIQLQNYTYYYNYNGGNPLENSTVFTYPWGGTLDLYHYFALNFKYGLLGPSADAGADVSIYTSEQAVTTLAGVATHTVAGTAMDYRWLEGTTVLQDWTAVGADGAASLNLGELVTPLAIGVHALTLEVRDASGLTASDTMVLTVNNTPPQAELAPATQVVEVGLDAIIVTGEVADFDGDELTYQWKKGDEVLASGTVTPPAGGEAVSIEDLIIPARDPGFPVGEHTVNLVVSDGVQPLPVTATATVTVQDTRRPTICPIPSRIILWPPDGELESVTVWVYVCDNGGGGNVTLDATVESSRPPAPGETDWYVDSIDQDHNIIHLRLRAEHRLPGIGRVYKITITGTDAGGNKSTAVLRIFAPRHGLERPWWF